MRIDHLILIGACLFLSGCITSQHPLSNVVKPDPLLLGDWKMTVPKTKPSLVHVTMTNNDWTQFDGREFFTDKPELPTDGLLFVTVIAGKNYINVVDSEPNGWEGFVFYRYEFIGNNRVIFYEISRPILTAAIKSGKLKGELGPTAGKMDDASIKITDSTENLARFVKNKPSLFSRKGFQLGSDYPVAGLLITPQVIEAGLAPIF